MRARVTIGVAVRNGAPMLSDALETVVAQDVDGLDILISDNASTDATPEIIAGFARRDARIRVVRHETTLRALDHFHWVKDQARGEYFMWAAHDDARAPDYASLLARALDAHPSAVLAFGDLFVAQEPCGVGSPMAFDFETTGMGLAARVCKTAFAECFHVYGLWRTSALARLPVAYTAWWPDLPVMTGAACLGEFLRVPGARFSYFRVIKTNEFRASYQDMAQGHGRVRALIGLERAMWHSCKVASGTPAAALAVTALTARQALDFPGFIVRRVRERI